MRYLFYSLGMLSLGLAGIGVILPLLPTTPLVILAAYFFTRGSPALRHWLEEHPKFGPSIQKWENYRVIPFGAKLAATLLICISLSYTLFWMKLPQWMDQTAFIWLQALIVILLSGILTFIWRCPSQAPAHFEESKKNQASS